MTNDESINQWIDESLEYIDQAVPTIESIKRSGLSEAKRGLEKVNKAEQLLIYMNYVRRILSAHQKTNVWSDPIITASLVDLSHQLLNFNNDLNDIAFGISNSDSYGREYHSRFIGTDGSTDSTGGTIAYLGANIELRIKSNDPYYEPVILDEEPDILPSRTDVLADLVSLLKPYNEKYIAMVEGSEESLFSGETDSLSQAAHSMRDCFEQLIRELAPTNVVKNQPWFEPTPEAPGDVSRRSRLRYILYGSGVSYDQPIVDRFDDLADIAKKSLDICIGTAHSHELMLSQESAQLAIDQARYNLFTILKLYNARS